jgi:hypothetical protein
MARKPNYRFERHERDRQKVAKKEARAKARTERAEQRKEDGVEGGPPIVAIDPATGLPVDRPAPRPAAPAKDEEEN